MAISYLLRRQWPTRPFGVGLTDGSIMDDTTAAGEIVPPDIRDRLA
jgi:hypothetical protein